MPAATFAGPDLTTFARLNELGLEVARQPSCRIGRCWPAA